MAENTSQKTMGERNRMPSNKMRQSLNKLIKQDIKMKLAVSDASKNLRNWQTHELALSNSNDKLRMELKNLQTENANLTQRIASKTESHLKLDEIFRKYEEINDEEDEQFWKFFVVETDKYRNRFTNAETEYDTILLKNDIEHYREMSNLVTDEIVKTDEEMVELTHIYGLLEVNTNKKTNCFEDLQMFQRILMEYDRSMSLSIRSAENRMQELNSKIRQKRREIENLSKRIQHH